MELIDQILAFLTSIEGKATLIAVFVEVVLRVIPSEKPRSLLLAAEAICRGIAACFSKAADILGKVIPQRLK